MSHYANITNALCRLLKNVPSGWMPTVLGCFALAMTPCAVTQANPTGKNPQVPFAVHGAAPEAKVMHAKLAPQLAELENFVAEAAKQNGRRTSAAPPKKLAAYRGMSAVAFFQSQRMTKLGEPAAIDFELRFARAQGVVHQMIQEFMMTPAGQKLKPSLIAQLTKTQPKRVKQLMQVRELLEKSDVTAAEAIMDPIIAEVEGLVYFLTEDERRPFVTGYDLTFVAVQAAATAKRSVDCKTALAAALTNNTVDVQSWKDWGNQVVTQLASTGKATVADSASLDGPAALEALKSQWLAAHAKLQRFAGLTWAISPVDTGRQDTSAAVAGELQTVALDTIKRIIEADAATIQASDVPGHHQRYLTALAQLSNLTSTNLLESSLDASLKQLLAKNPVYQQQVDQYQAATRDLMIFDQRQREQKLAALQAKFPAADAVVRKGVEIVDQQPGLVLTQSNYPMLPTLSSPANLTIQTVGPRLMNQVVSLKRVRALSADAKVEVAGLDSRTYGSILRVMLPQAEVSRVAALLLVDTAHPPLSLAGMHAIQCLVEGTYEAAGGQIMGFQLEPVVARFASMPDVAATIVPLGSAGAAAAIQMHLNQMMMRVDVVPQWVLYPFGTHWVTAGASPGQTPKATAPAGSPVTAPASPPAAAPASPPAATPPVAPGTTPAASAPSSAPSNAAPASSGTIPALPSEPAATPGAAASGIPDLGN